MKVQVEIPDDLFEAFKHPIAGVHYLRENPRKRWTVREYKEVIRLNILNLLERYRDEQRKLLQ